MSRFGRWTSGLFPPWGSRRYELFDSSLFLLALVFVNYIWNTASERQQAALPPLTLLDGWAWGLALSMVAFGGIACSYSQRSKIVRSGMTLVIIGSSFWSLCYVLGLFSTGDERTFLSALIYGGIASRLSRENGGRRYDRKGRRTCRSPTPA